MDDGCIAAAQQKNEVLFVADLVCPWSRIALHTLAPLVQERGVALRWHPFLLNPSLPPQGVARAVYLERAFGSAETAQRTLARVRQRGRELGLAFAFERILHQPDSCAAHALLLAAPLERQLALAERLFCAFFEEGADLGDPEVLVALAGAGGLPREEACAAFTAAARTRVREAHRRAATFGIDGVPALVLEGVGVLAGAQPREVFEGFLDLARVLGGRAGRS